MESTSSNDTCADKSPSVGAFTFIEEVSKPRVFTGESILKTLLTSPSTSKNRNYRYFYNNSSSESSFERIKVRKVFGFKPEQIDFGDQTNSISTTDLRNKFLSRNVSSGSLASVLSIRQVNSFINKFGSELITSEAIIGKSDDGEKEEEINVEELMKRVPAMVVRHFTRREEVVTSSGAKQEARQERCYDEDSNECIPSLNVEVELHEECNDASTTESGPGCVKSEDAEESTSQSRQELQCVICGRQFNFKKNMNKHLRHVHAVGRFACAVCPLDFEKRRDLIKHRDIHSESGEAGGGFRCETCGKLIQWFNHFIQHRKTHETNVLLDRDEVNRHHICPVCNKAFRSNANLRVHIRTHTGERPYGCDVCGARFSQKRIQVDHMNKHTGARPYSCTHCAATFSNYITFNVHKRTRHAVSSHACAVCAAKFVWKSSLDAHMRSHGDALQCAQCGRRFARREALAVHRRTHCLAGADGRGRRKHRRAEADRLACTECGRKFSKIAALALHRRTKHCTVAT